MRSYDKFGALGVFLVQFRPRRFGYLAVLQVKIGLYDDECKVTVADVVLGCITTAFNKLLFTQPITYSVEVPERLHKRKHPEPLNLAHDLKS